MDKKKIMILVVSILVLLVIVIFSVILLFGTKEDTDVKEPDEGNDLALNEDLNIDEEFLFEYNKDTLAETSSTEIKEMEKALEEKGDSTSEGTVTDKGEDVEQSTAEQDYSNFFGDNTNKKEIDAVKKSVSKDNFYDDVDEINKDFAEKRDKMEKLTDTALSKDVASKLVKSEFNLSYSGFGDYLVQADTSDGLLYVFAYNQKVPVKDKDEGKITISINKNNSEFYNIEKYKDNFLSLFKYVGLNDNEIGTVYKEFESTLLKEVELRKTNKNSFSNNFKYLLNDKVLMSYDGDLVMFVIY